VGGPPEVDRVPALLLIHAAIPRPRHLYRKRLNAAF
jgi:hypothetical protein